MDDDQLFDHGGGVDEAGPGAVSPLGAVGILGILCAYAGEMMVRTKIPFVLDSLHIDLRRFQH